MTPSKLREKIIAERMAWIRQMIMEIKRLPIESSEVFLCDSRNVAAAESYLRRALEALMDLGRHILAKSFGRPVVEYKEIPSQLHKVRVLEAEDAALMREMAGYRNRMVHFYSEITNDELYDICSRQLSDLERVLASILKWINAHPELLDRSL